MKNITKKKNFCRSIRHLVDDRDSRNHAVAVALTVTFDRQLAPLLYNQFNQVPYTIIKLNNFPIPLSSQSSSPYYNQVSQVPYTIIKSIKSQEGYALFHGFKTMIWKKMYAEASEAAECVRSDSGTAFTTTVTAKKRGQGRRRGGRPSTAVQQYHSVPKWGLCDFYQVPVGSKSNK